jgi:hypothetical protein
MPADKDNGEGGRFTRLYSRSAHPGARRGFRYGKGKAWGAECPAARELRILRLQAIVEARQPVESILQNL